MSDGDAVFHSGDDGDRTHDLRLAKPALYQLSYIPAGHHSTKAHLR
jgi:hypothetical protein